MVGAFFVPKKYTGRVSESRDGRTMSGNMPDFLKRSQQQKRTQQDKASARPSARPAAGSAMPPATLTPDEPDDPTLIIDTLDARPVPAMPTPEA